MSTELAGLNTRMSSFQLLHESNIQEGKFQTNILTQTPSKTEKMKQVRERINKIEQIIKEKRKNPY